MIEWEPQNNGYYLIADIGPFRIEVDTVEYKPDGAWLFSCAGIRIFGKKLKAKTADAAKLEAVVMLRGALIDALEELGDLNPYINIGCESCAQRHINCEAEAAERLCRFWVKAVSDD